MYGEGRLALPPVPDRETGEPRPPAAPGGSRGTNALSSGPVPDAHPRVPDHLGPMLEWSLPNRRFRLQMSFAAVALGVVYSTVVDGFAWLSNWQLWAFLVAFGVFAYWRFGGQEWRAAGAVWFQAGKSWANTYELVEVKVSGGNRPTLELRDSSGRQAVTALEDIRASPRVWDLVYNGILHSAASGDCYVSASARKALKLPSVVVTVDGSSGDRIRSTRRRSARDVAGGGVISRGNGVVRWPDEWPRSVILIWLAAPLAVAFVSGGVALLSLTGWAAGAVISMWFFAIGAMFLSACGRPRPSALSGRVRVEKLVPSTGEIIDSGTPGILIPASRWFWFRNLSISLVVLLAGPAFTFMYIDPESDIPLPVTVGAWIFTLFGIWFAGVTLLPGGGFRPRIHLSREGMFVSSNTSCAFTRWTSADSATATRQGRVRTIAVSGGYPAVVKRRRWGRDNLVEYPDINVSALSFDIDSALLLEVLDRAVGDEPGWRDKLGNGEALRELKSLHSQVNAR